MFKWIVNEEESDISKVLELSNLKDFYQKVPLYQKVNDFPYNNLCEKLDYDIVVLKPVKDDFLILYVNKVFWRIYGENFPDYMKGRLLGELFPIFKKTGVIKKYTDSYNNKTENKFLFKMLEDENLIFAGDQFCVRQNDLLFVFTKDQTEYYEKHDSEKKSTFPIIKINKYGKIIDANNSFFKNTKYSIEELNLIGLESILKTFNSPTQDAKNFNELLNLMFKYKIPVFDFEAEILRKNGTFTWLTVHMRLINNESVRLILRDITDNKKQELIVKDLMEQFSDLEGSKNTAFIVYDGENYHLSENIFNILEIEPNPKLLKSNLDLITEFILTEDKDYVVKNILKLCANKTSVIFNYRIKTKNNNIKYLKSNLKFLGYGNGYYGFITDRTEEHESKEEFDKLQKNLNTIKTSSNVGISSYKNGEFHYSPEIFNMLEIESNKQTYNEDIFKKYVDKNERSSWLNLINNLSPENPHGHKLTTLHTHKGNLKIIDNTVDAEFNDEGKIIEYISFVRDVTMEELSKKQALELQENLDIIGDFSKIFIETFENGEFNYTKELYNILEIDNPEDYSPNEINELFLLPEDREIFYNLISNVSVDNPDFKIISRVKTVKDNLKFISVYAKATFDDEGEFIKLIAFEQDVTDEVLVKEEALELKENLDIVGGFSKIVIGHYENGEFSWTPEIFNILKINPEDYPSNVDIIQEFASENDKIVFLDILEMLTPNNNTCSTVRELNDSEGNLIYLKYQIVGNFDKNNNLVSVTGFLQDVTEETLAKKETLRLTQNFELIQDTSKIGFARYEKGKYYFTPVIYDILAISPDDYSDDVNVVNDFVVPEDNAKFTNNFNLSPKYPSNQVSYRIRNAHGELKYLYVHNKAKFDKDGELLYIVGFIQDVTNEELAKNEALDLQNSLNTLGSFSKIVIAYYEDGIYTWTPEIYNILKIKHDDFPNDVDLIAEFSTPEDNQAFSKAMDELSPEKNTLSGTRIVYDNEGNLKYLNIRLVAEFDHRGKILSIHKFIQDVTEETLTKESALQLQEDVRIIQKGSKITLVHYENEEFKWTSEIYDILEIDSKDYPDNIDLVDLFNIPEDKGSFAEKMSKVTPENPRFNHTSTIKTVNGNIKYVESFSEFKFDENNVPVEFVAFVHDITDKVLREQELEQLSEERKFLLQEVHHRVKNNLQLVSSFLSLDSRYYQDRPEYVIAKTQTRIDAMATAHEEVYKSNNVSNINVESLLVGVLSDLFVKLNANNISRRYDIETVFIDIDKAMPLSFLVSELAVNSINHAFPNGEKGHFCVELKDLKDSTSLYIWDDGVGLPENLDILSSDTLGFTVIRRLASQLEAELSVLSDVSGFGVELILPKS